MQTHRQDEPSTHGSLILQLQASSAAVPASVWQRFVHLYGPLIYRWVRRSGLQCFDASDVTQDVLMSVHRDVKQFDLLRENVRFRGWLWTITKRRVADHFRSGREERLLGSEADDLAQPRLSDDPPTDVATDRQTLLRRAVAMYRDRFEPKTWQAFWATAVEGREPEEVAETLGMSRWGIYKARARILQRLREELQGLLD